MFYIVWICILFFITSVYCQCNKVLNVGYTASHVQSPNYDNGYPTNLKCSWRHTTSIAGSSLLVQINATVDCTGDDITIYDGTDSTGLILHSCTTSTPSYIIATTGSIYTLFTTDSSSNVAEKGFAYNVISAKDLSGSACTSTVKLVASNTKQYISSPNYPAAYSPDSSCTWRIERIGTTNPMELSFKFIDIEWEANGQCSYDYVKITDDETGTTVLTTCGNNEWFPTQTYTTTGNITVQFNSDATQHQRGFLLAYYLKSSLAPGDGNDDDDSCFLDNCVILPVLIAVGGVVLIAIIAGVIICIVSKVYIVPKKVRVRDISKRGVRKKTSLKSIIIPRIGNIQREIFGPINLEIISKPPLATEGMRKVFPNGDGNPKTGGLNHVKSVVSNINESSDGINKKDFNTKSSLMPLHLQV